MSYHPELFSIYSAFAPENGPTKWQRSSTWAGQPAPYSSSPDYHSKQPHQVPHVPREYDALPHALYLTSSKPKGAPSPRDPQTQDSLQDRCKYPPSRATGVPTAEWSKAHAENAMEHLVIPAPTVQ